MRIRRTNYFNLLIVTALGMATALYVMYPITSAQIRKSRAESKKIQNEIN